MRPHLRNLKRLIFALSTRYAPLSTMERLLHAILAEQDQLSAVTNHDVDATRALADDASRS